MGGGNVPKLRKKSLVVFLHHHPLLCQSTGVAVTVLAQSNRWSYDGWKRQLKL
jgi:hypothetical protein